MINHKLRCIFVHIPRTGGSSVEHWLCGKDWWGIDPATKHLSARQTRALYAPYWDNYFKFSIVRHPISRVASMMRYARYFGLSRSPDGQIGFADYLDRFGSPVTVEFDHRFHRREDVVTPDHLPGQIYGNILDCDLDFIGRFETLHADMEAVRTRLGVAVPMAVHAQQSTRPKPVDAVSASRAAIAAMYARDLVTYGYGETL